MPVDKLRIIPLGGLGEVGMNMMALEYANDIIIIDAGFMFPREEMPGIGMLIPDVDCHYSWTSRPYRCIALHFT